MVERCMAVVEMHAFLSSLGSLLSSHFYSTRIHKYHGYVGNMIDVNMLSLNFNVSTVPYLVKKIHAEGWSCSFGTVHVGKERFIAMPTHRRAKRM